MNKLNKFDIRRIDEETMEGQIVTSLLDDDFYKFSMGEFVFQDTYLREREVAWKFKNRALDIKLADYIDEQEFFHQYDSYRKLQATKTELHYLRGTNEYDVRMFSENYLEHLRDIKLPEVSFHKDASGQLDIQWSDKYKNSTYPETAILKIISGLYFRKILSRMSRLEREAVYSEGTKRLLEKINKLKQNPRVTFSDFANRRSPSPSWHEYVYARTLEEIPLQVKGSSKVSLAMKYDSMPMGTCAHELSMILVAIGFDGTKESIIHAFIKLHEDWWSKYGEGLSICLPDTYGTDFALSILPKSLMSKYKGYRLDSKNMFEAVRQILSYLNNVLKVDPKTKLLIPSDGLNVDQMIDLTNEFSGETTISHGWGTQFSNDLGIRPLPIVCKPMSVDGKGCVKLSDNVAKGTGTSKDLESYVQAIDYKNTYQRECIV